MAKAQIIINADDFGYSPAINYAIMDSHLDGILTSTTMMANGKGFDHAVNLSKSMPHLGIGVHLVLSYGKSLTQNKTLTDSKGYFHGLKYLEENMAQIDLEELEKEWESQILKIREAGIPITHLDSHHHVHSMPALTPVFEKLALRYDLPVRNNAKYQSNLKKPHRFETNFDSIAIEPEHRLRSYLNNILMDAKTYGSVELMCHPGYIDQYLIEGSSLLDNRARVAHFLQHSDFKEFLQKHSEIELIHFGEL